MGGGEGDLETVVFKKIQKAKNTTKVFKCDKFYPIAFIQWFYKSNFILVIVFTSLFFCEKPH